MMKEFNNAPGKDQQKLSNVEALLMPSRTRGGGAPQKPSADPLGCKAELTGVGPGVPPKQQAGQSQQRSISQPSQALRAPKTQPPPGLMGKPQGLDGAARWSRKKKDVPETEDTEEWLIPTGESVSYKQWDESDSKMYGFQGSWSLSENKLGQKLSPGADDFTKTRNNAYSKGGDGSESPRLDVGGYGAAETATVSALEKHQKRSLSAILRRSREKIPKEMLVPKTRQPLVPPLNQPGYQQLNALRNNSAKPPGAAAGALQQARIDPGLRVSSYGWQPDDCLVDKEDVMSRQLSKRSDAGCDDEEMGEADEPSLQELFAGPTCNMDASSWILNPQADLLQPQGNNAMQLARVEPANDLADPFNAMSRVQLRSYIMNHPLEFLRPLSRIEIALWADLHKPPGKLDSVSIQRLFVNACGGVLGSLKFTGQGSLSLQLSVDGQAHPIVERGTLRLYGKTEGGPARLTAFGLDSTQRLLELFVTNGDKSAVDKAEVLFTCQHMVGVVINGVPITKVEASNGMLRFTALQYERAQLLQHHLGMGTA